MRGVFVCVEGIDRSGKTTQCEVIARWLSEKTGRGCLVQKYPDRSSGCTLTGPLLDKYLRKDVDIDDGHAVHLLFSANRWETRSRIVAALEAGTSVVADRYAFSGAAYTMARCGIDARWCLAPDTGLPAPDLVVYIDIPPSVAIARLTASSPLHTTNPAGLAERYEREDLLAAVAGVFRTQIIGRHDIAWSVVDGTAAQDAVSELITSRALPLLNFSAITSSPIKTLFSSP